MAQVITPGEVVTIHDAGAGHVVDGVVVTALVGGGFAVAWKENISGGSYIVTARLDGGDNFVDLDEATAGNFRIVNPDTVPSSPTISGTSNGGFVVGFYDRSPYVARFDAASFTTLDVIPHDPDGINFYVQTSPVVAGLDGGGYVAAYTGEYDGAADDRVP